MPFYWTSDDTKYASICAAVPASAAIFGTLYAANDAKVVNFLKGQQYPKKLAPSCQFFYLGMNVATVAPFGYASYLVYKIGGGFDYMDTTVALGFYGGTIAASLAMGLPLYYRNVKSLAITNGILAALAMATAVAFYKIDHISGYWAIPFTLWTLYCASVNGKVSGCCNKKVAIE